MFSDHRLSLVSLLCVVYSRSDVYGQVLPLFGQDWSHFGVVSCGVLLSCVYVLDQARLVLCLLVLSDLPTVYIVMQCSGALQCPALAFRV